MDRRTFMTATAAAGAAAFMAGEASAAELKLLGDYPPLALASGHCVASGQACLEHCLVLFGEGEKELAGCAQSVNQLIAACSAMQALAIDKSKHVPTFAKVVATVCEDCEKECRKHETKHEVCKNCAEACKACAAECRKASA